MHESLQVILGMDWFPHVYVLRTRPDLPWISASTNLSIAAAHFGIVLVLWQVMRKRKESEFRWVALLFGMFNGIRCLTQSLGVWPFWHPSYELHWGFRAATAVLAVSTAVALVRSLPALHRLPSAADLEKEIEERRVAEEAALEKEERLRNFVESVQDYAMYMVDIEGVIQSWNSGAERMTGYPADEIIGHNCSRFLLPEDVSAGRAERSLQIVKETGRFEEESRLLRKDGSPLLAHITMRPLLDPTGNLRGFSKVVRDITEPRALEAKYEILLDATPDGILMVDESGRIQFANERVESLFGYSHAELLGRDCLTLAPQHLRARQARRHEEFFRDPEGFVLEHDVEPSGLRKDGSLFQLEASFRPLQTPVGLVAMVSLRDVTERANTEARFQTMLEAAPDAVVIYSQRNGIAYVNRRAEWLFGRDRVELIGQPAEILVPERFRSERSAAREQFFHSSTAAGKSTGAERVYLRKDGTEFEADVTVSPIETSDGPLLLAFLRDSTERRLAEEAIREREERFRRFVDGVDDYAIYMIDAEGFVQTWNHGAERMKGYTADEITGRNFEEFYTAEDRAAGKPQEALRTAVETGLFKGEGWRVRKDGSRFLANVTMRPLRDSQGALRGFSKVTRDITDSRELETRFQVLLEAAPDAFLIVNRAGEIEFINAQGEKIFGYAREEVLGKSVDMFNPERVREIQAVYRDQLFSGSGRAEGGSETDLWGLRKDGTEFPLEFTLSPLDTKDGRVFLFALRDITERKKTEARFQALLESAPDAMVIVNSDGCIELANLQTEKLFGYSRLELAGKSVDTLVPHGLQGAHAAHRAEFFRNPKKREMGANLDLMALRKDGSQFPVEISLSPLTSPDGISVTAAIRDISERREAARQLAEKMTELHQSNEALEQFAHIASHDLQEPLRMVASYTQLLSRRYKGRLDADADEFIDFAVDGTQRMKRLIEDLLLYSRAGKGAPPVVEFDANGSLREAVGNLHAAIEESHAEVTSDLLPNLVAVESQLVQLLQNLIGNAIKYRGDRSPKVHVSAEAGCKEWIFSVADNGIGIDPKYFDRIFQIFQRLHGRGEYAGTGIGLAICKRILQQQGGRIWLESEPGHGSVFHFSLPVR